MASIPLRLLLIEDDAEDALVIERLLSRAAPGAFELRRASRLAQGCKLLSSERFDAVLLDIVLPGGVGIEAFLKVREQLPEAPIIVLAGLKDEALALQAVGLGAQDYLLKGVIDDRRLICSIRHAVERAGISRQWESLLAKDEDGKLVINAQGVVRYANAAAKLFLGRKSPELIGKPLPAGLPLAAPEAAMVLLPDGSQRLIEARFTPLEWDGEQGSLLRLRDVTERRQCARAEAAGMERTVAVELNIDLMLAMTQELSEPLSTTRSALSQLRGGTAGPVTDRQADYLEIARSAVVRQLRIIEDARDLARFQSGRLKPELRRVDLAALIQESLRGRGAAGPRFEGDVPSPLPEVSGDPGLLARLLSNLLDHASGCAKERVLVRAVAPGTAVVVSVIDDGLGGAKSVSLETGLGLAVCREIVSRHGGRLWVESAMGRGSRFHFSLPRSVEA